MIHVSIRKRSNLPHLTRLIALLLLLIVPLAVAYAGGQAGADDEVHEEDHHDEPEHGDDHDDDHGHEHAEGVPHIEPIATDGPLALVATTNIVGDVLENIAGDLAEVTVIIGRGENPHSYEPTPRALRSLERAHIVFINGLALEENLLDDVEAIATGYVVPVSAGIDPLPFDGFDHDHDEDHDEDEHHDDEDHDDHDDEDHHDDEHDDHVHAEGDPHVWMDPNNVILWVEIMVEALAEADPENAETYEANGEAYVAELEEVDAWITEELSSIPEERRTLIADHAFFNYFADEYDFTTVGAIIPSTTDTAEPSAQEVAELVELIREEEVRAIFVGRSAGRSLTELANSISQEVGGELRILPTLTGSLAPEGEEGDTYLGFLRYNANQIVSGLGE